MPQWPAGVSKTCACMAKDSTRAERGATRIALMQPVPRAARTPLRHRKVPRRDAKILESAPCEA
jgi:hypothetical protein